MLAVSPLRSCSIKNESEMEGGFSIEGNDHESFFGSGDLLESIIDFDDLFVGFSDGDVLPDLEMDSDLVHEFSVSNTAGDGVSSEMNNAAAAHENFEEREIVSEREESAVVNPSPTRGEKGRSKSTSKKNHAGKKKVKVDWTPELHRRFVQAVEQLGVDKAVPSRILELMGIDCLTRHNIASHLQKYRSHRKHLLAREAEAASWSQRRQMYGAAAAAVAKGEVNPWIAPTMGFPPAAPPPPMPHLIRPVHVWGHPHPSADQSLQHIWPKHLAPPPHAWPPAHPLPLPAPSDPSFWHSHHQYVPTPGTPCFAPHLPPTRFPAPPVAGIPSPAMYKVDSGIGMPTGQPLPQSPSDVHPSTESIDAAIGDVLRKPWLPLPLGLKPPSIDGVMVELKRQGISKVPPSCH